MAGDYMPMRTDLESDPDVVRISLRCRVHVCHVIGALHYIWSVANNHTTDGLLKGYAPEFVNVRVGIDSFCESVQEVGWLTISNDGMQIANFEKWNGKGAKRRIQAAQSMRTSRQQKRNTSATKCALTGEDRREEKRKEDNSAASSLNGESLRASKTTRAGKPENRNDVGDALKNSASQKATDARSVVESLVAKMGVPTFDFERFSGECQKIRKAVSDPECDYLIWEAIYAAESALSWAWLWSAVRGLELSKATNRGGWFRDVLRATARERGIDFDEITRGLRVPRHLLRSPVEVRR